MKVYISGPIAGQPNGNTEAFEVAEEVIRAAGHEPVNPQKIFKGHKGRCTGPTIMGQYGVDAHRYGCYVKPDLIAMLGCEAIYLLPGWHSSRGAVVEVQVASICGLVFVDRESLMSWGHFFPAVAPNGTVS